MQLNIVPLIFLSVGANRYTSPLLGLEGGRWHIMSSGGFMSNSITLLAGSSSLLIMQGVEADISLQCMYKLGFSFTNIHMPRVYTERYTHV